MKHFNSITTPRELDRLLLHLHSQQVIAVDTESDSLYSYFEKVCLLQISTETSDYIIDPLAVDIAPVGSIFADAAIEKIFHAAEYDILSLKRDYGFQFHNIFDTMLAAKTLGWPQTGLGNILQTHFQVKINKKFQQYNWGKRPLLPQALQYAHLDTHYLHRLRAIQLHDLQKQHRVEEARAAFKRISSATPNTKIFDPADFWRIKGVKFLSPQQQALLQALFVFRDTRARHQDVPPFKIMSDTVMRQLAESPPRSLSELKNVKGLNRTLVKRHGEEIVSLLRARHPAPSPNHKRKSGRHPFNGSDLLRYEHLRSWRNTLAEKRGVEPDVILPNGTLKAIAKANPSSLAQLKSEEILGDWQFNTYAQTIVQELLLFNHHR